MRLRTVALAVAAAVAIQFIAGFAIWRLLPDWAARGDFGSMFGAVSALFSGLALAGVIYAILLQRAELALQREELVESSGRGCLRRHQDTGCIRY